MKRLTFLGLGLSALAAVSILASACIGGDGLVTATPLSATGGTGSDDSRNIPGEIFDSLLNGKTVGTRNGNTTFIAGKGLQFTDVNAFLAYEPFYPYPNGEFSMEVEGLRPNGPGGKPKIFQIGDQRDANLTNSTSMINAQYRGSPGNPDNCIAFKAVLGSSSAVAEPDLGTRGASVVSLDPGKTYYWQGRWTNNTFNLVVKDGGINGSVIYDRTLTANGGTGFAASQMFAFIGSNDAKFGADTGTFPGMIVRNVWLSNKPRP